MSNNDQPGGAAARWPFTSTDLAALRAAYRALTRVGNETADAGEWDESLDQAQHGVGLVLALSGAMTPAVELAPGWWRAAQDGKTDKSGGWPPCP